MDDFTRPLKSASAVIDFLGGTSATAELLDVLPSSVSNWRHDGLPARLHRRIEKLITERGGRAAESVFQ